MDKSVYAYSSEIVNWADNISWIRADQRSNLGTVVKWHGAN